MKKLYTFLVVSLCVLMLVTQAGCLLFAAAAGTGAGVAYVKGDTDAVLEGNPKQVAQATVAAVEDMDMHVISNESSSLDAKVVARTASDARVTIVAKSEAEKLTKVSIRVGKFGDEAIQSALLEKIKENL